MGKTLPPLPEPTGDTWTLRGSPRPPTIVVRPESVLAGLLACLATRPNGATLAECQAAVQDVVVAQRLKGKHPVLRLMRWAAPNRGITFVCSLGKVTCRLPDGYARG